MQQCSEAPTIFLALFSASNLPPTARLLEGIEALRLVLSDQICGDCQPRGTSRHRLQLVNNGAAVFGAIFWMLAGTFMRLGV